MVVVLVFIFNRDCWPIMGGHEMTGYWRRGFQVGDGMETRLGTGCWSFRWCCAGGTRDGTAMGGH